MFIEHRHVHQTKHVSHKHNMSNIYVHEAAKRESKLEVDGKLVVW